MTSSGSTTGTGPRRSARRFGLSWQATLPSCQLTTGKTVRRDVLGLLRADGDHIEWVIQNARRVNEVSAEGVEEHLAAWTAEYRRDSED